MAPACWTAFLTGDDGLDRPDEHAPPLFLELLLALAGGSQLQLRVRRPSELATVELLRAEIESLHEQLRHLASERRAILDSLSAAAVPTPGLVPQAPALHELAELPRWAAENEDRSLADGRGCRRDLDRAYACFEEAARLGNPDAMFALGTFLQSKEELWRGVRDLDRAADLYCRAMSLGVDLARTNLRCLHAADCEHGLSFCSGSRWPRATWWRVTHCGRSSRACSAGRQTSGPLAVTPGTPARRFTHP